MLMINTIFDNLNVWLSSNENINIVYDKLYYLFDSNIDLLYELIDIYSRYDNQILNIVDTLISKFESQEEYEKCNNLLLIKMHFELKIKNK